MEEYIRYQRVQHYNFLVLEIFSEVWKDKPIEDKIDNLYREGFIPNKHDMLNLVSFATIYNRFNTVIYLDQRFLLVSDIMVEKPRDPLTVTDGKIFQPLKINSEINTKSMSEENYGNAFIAGCRHNEILSYFVEQTTNFNPQLVEEAFLISCLHNRMGAISNLVGEPIFYNVLSNSLVVQSYLAEPTENKNLKNQVEKLLLNQKLENQLENKNIMAKKVKI